MGGFCRTSIDDKKCAVIIQPDNKKQKTGVGNIFRGFHKSTGKSQRTFADKYGIDRGNLSKLEQV